MAQEDDFVDHGLCSSLLLWLPCMEVVAPRHHGAKVSNIAAHPDLFPHSADPSVRRMDVDEYRPEVGAAFDAVVKFAAGVCGPRTEPFGDMGVWKPVKGAKA